MFGDSRGTYRATARDRALADTRIVSVLGPVHGLRAGDVRATLRRLVEHYPNGRLSLVPRSNRAQWRRNRVVGDESVVEMAPLADPAELLTRIRRYDTGEPLRVFVAGRYLVLDASRGLGDCQLATATLAALARGHVDPSLDLPATATSLPGTTPRSARVVTMCGRIRLVDSFRRDRVSGDDETVSATPPVRWASSKRVVSATMPAEATEQLSRWASRHHPHVTIDALSEAAYSAALRQEGVTVDDPQPPRPCGRSGRRVPDRVTGRVALTVTHLGRSGFAETLTAAQGGYPLALIRYRDPDGPESLILHISQVGAVRTVSASFHDAVVDRYRVQAALDRASTDPAGVLTDLHAIG